MEKEQNKITKEQQNKTTETNNKLNKQKNIEDLSIIELKAELFDRQQIIQKVQKEINILTNFLNNKIDSE